MKQIGLAFRIWALDHGNQYPCNVGVGDGGTKEMCSWRNSDHFEKNPAVHLLVLSNELSTPKILVCPGDSEKSKAPDFQGLTAANVSYQLRSGTNISAANADEVLARCPIHGHTLHCDATVASGTEP
jgi:hypothetical protein